MVEAAGVEPEFDGFCKSFKKQDNTKYIEKYM